MMVLAIIGYLVAVFISYSSAMALNEHFYRKYRYEPFDFTNALIVYIGYAFIIFGYAMATNTNHDSSLDGQVLLFLGIAAIVLTVIINMKKINSFEDAIALTIGQLVIYAVFLPLVIILIGLLSKITPTYDLNEKD